MRRWHGGCSTLQPNAQAALAQSLRGRHQRYRMEFLALEQQTLQLDLTEYAVPPVDTVLGLLAAITEPQAAAQSST